MKPIKGSQAVLFLSAVLSVGSQFAFANSIDCTGGTGPNTVYAHVITEEGEAFIHKRSPQLPRYWMTCQKAEAVFLRCDERGGRSLLLDSATTGRYFGSEKTTKVTCTERFRKSDSRGGKAGDSNCKGGGKSSGCSS